MKQPHIIHKDKSFLAIDKPAGMMVAQVKAVGQIVPKDPEKTLTGWLDKNHPGAKLVHRLDKDTSGIILASLNEDYYDYLKSLFRERKIKKTYLALVRGVLPKKTGVIKSAIGIKSGMTRHTIHSTKKSKESIVLLQ